MTKKNREVKDGISKIKRRTTMIDIPAGEIIANCRERRGMTKTELSKRCGISVTQICNYEKGRSDPTLTSFNSMLRAMGFEMDVYEVDTANAIWSQDAI